MSPDSQQETIVDLLVFYTQSTCKEGFCPMISFDAHVHIQENVSIDVLLDSGRRNFSRRMHRSFPGLPASFFLFLTEANKYNSFAELKKAADTGRHITPGGWRIAATPEPESLLVTRDDWPGGRLFMLAGRQIVTAEKLEVLALATTAMIADGLALHETVEAVRKGKGLAVLPWGAGKWLGKRGEIVDSYLQSATPEGLFVGDNGGRPVFWPTPRPFLTAENRGIRLLPGSDPLPLAGEELRVGSYGGWLPGECSDDHPSADIKALLTGKSAKITPFGNRQGVLDFCRNQLALRLK